MRQFVVVAIVFLTGTASLEAVELKELQETMKQKDFAKAVSLANEYINEHPQDLRGYSIRGRALVETSQFGPAIADLNKVLEGGKGQRGQVHYYRGRAQIALGKRDEALADFDKAVTTITELIKLLPADGTKDAKQKRELYKSKKPYRQKAETASAPQKKSAK